VNLPSEELRRAFRESPLHQSQIEAEVFFGRANSMLPDAYGSDSILRHGQTSSLAMARSSPSSCTVTVKFIFTILSIVFLTLGGVRFINDNCTVKPAAKTWLLIGCIFAAVSAWLFISQ
jgi:hypothetical protein